MALNRKYTLKFTIDEVTDEGGVAICHPEVTVTYMESDAERKYSILNQDAVDEMVLRNLCIQIQKGLKESNKQKDEKEITEQGIVPLCSSALKF